MIDALREEQRYTRHALVPGWNQGRLAAAGVVIAGVGALGTEVARLLAQAGVGRLLLCDPDTVSVSNLSRSCLFAEADVGRPKVEAAAHALGTLAPGTSVTPRYGPLTSGIGLAELRDSDLVISCLDSDAARVSLASRCTMVGVGMSDAGTSPWGGEVRHFEPGGACYACGLTPRQRAVEDDPWSCAAPVPGIEAGASAPVSALIGAWLATHAVRRLCGLTAGPPRLRVDVETGATASEPVARDPDCPLHEHVDPATTRLLALDENDTVRDLLVCVAPDEEVLTWAEFPAAVAPHAADRRSPSGTRRSRLRLAPPTARLVDLGVAPREILPVVCPSDPDRIRHLELAPHGLAEVTAP